ncbi:GTP-binding protein [Pseudoxanthobacter sp.]|uniref:CobW family GTP-binding protein n=1 Tax=Pseudoxanthobacter sp. TaxID=1925742 RepID=UPI002FDF1C19
MLFSAAAPPPGAAVPAADGRIPVTILTGFLGAGKTTLLSRLIAQPEMAGTAVLINEFGAIGIDHHLVESLDEATVLLASGCLCCSVRGDLADALKRLHARLSRRELARLDRIVIETTGLADPLPVVATLAEDRFLAARFVCDGVITVVDASLGLGQLGRQREAVRQVAMADRLILTKTDLADAATFAALSARLAALNPAADRIVARHGAVAPAALFAAGVHAPCGEARVLGWLGEAEAGDDPHRDSRATSFSLTLPPLARWRGFAVVMGGILADYGPRLLRIKGLIALCGAMAPAVIQCVEDVACPVTMLKRWPAGTTETGRLVFIGEGLDAAAEADIRARLSDLPDDIAARRIAARRPLLATRCWLSAPVPATDARRFETEAFRVQPHAFAGTAGRTARTGRA